MKIIFLVVSFLVNCKYGGNNKWFIFYSSIGESIECIFIKNDSYMFVWYKENCCDIEWLLFFNGCNKNVLKEYRD